MQIKEWIVGTADLRLVCAEPHIVLNYISQKGVQLKCIRWIDDLTVEITVAGGVQRMIHIVERKFQCEFTVLKAGGLLPYGQRALKRSVLICGVVAFLVLSLYLQNHILFIEVIGNSSVPDRKILENAEVCGLYFGADRNEIRSEQIKNMLLEQIPQLQWIGINTAGCVATISVRERTETEGTVSRDMTPASIVASMDGRVCAVTASKGTVLCQVGQQVTAGQTLISGMNKCGEIMLMTRAQGEVMADTERELVIKTIPPTVVRTDLKHAERKISIIFGKNLINLFKDSGILDGSCVKISKRYELRLPKGFILPVSICCEQFMYYAEADPVQDENEYEWLLQQAAQYTVKQMIAGEIVSATSEQHTNQFFAAYTVKYSCREMIGQIKKEELFCIYGKNS